MEARDKGLTLYRKGLKNAEIAERLGVSVNTVKTWQRRYWKDETRGSKCTQKEGSKSEPGEPAAPKKKQGAPKGNVNAVGKIGGPPLGSTNALKHGGYSAVMFGTFAAEQRQQMEEAGTPTEEELLLQEIDLLTLRERYLLDRMQKVMKQKTCLRQVNTSQHQQSFKRLDGDDMQEEFDKEEYIRRQDTAVQAGERMPGNSTQVTTVSESADLRLERLETLLTNVQKQKAKVIAQLGLLHKEQSGSTRDIEDLSSIRKAVFGDDDYSDQDAGLSVQPEALGLHEELPDEPD
ncbi:MAG: helix-turn-helix domain-containing protein [Oscillospiraceae bacterium]|nr:helix-turn-helix domain-containing protein [Oscillospiraceae bacterium]